MNTDLTPRGIVSELDKYIVGQRDAKRAVAVALRNRIRRRRLPDNLQDEVLPKNILMIGPTGVGKTEIARRLARLVNAPFVKVEATRFTEVGYVGRDVDGMIRDLVETAIRMVKSEQAEKVRETAETLAGERLVELLSSPDQTNASIQNPFEALFGGVRPPATEESEETKRLRREEQRRLRERLMAGEMEDETVEIEVEEAPLPVMEMFSGSGMDEMGAGLQEMLGGMLPRKRKRRKVTVAEARRLLAQEEAQKLIDMDEVRNEGIRRVEQMGIVFLDEIDKVVGRGAGAGPDVSREGVQRDILPIVEGSTVMTRYGQVKTDHILFIAAGAFEMSKPSEMIPELQGRFPIRVELENLSVDDFRRILTEPRNALTKQYQALLATDGVDLEFTEDGIDEIARITAMVNERTENIGARRLHTILEKLLSDISFQAPDSISGHMVIDRTFVRERLAGVVEDLDLSRYIL